MVLALIAALLLGLIGIGAWLVSLRRSKLPRIADAALFGLGTLVAGFGTYYVVFRVLNYAVIMAHTSDPGGFAASMFFAGLFLLMSMGVGSFVTGCGILTLRLVRARGPLLPPK